MSDRPFASIGDEDLALLALGACIRGGTEIQNCNRQPTHEEAEALYHRIRAEAAARDLTPRGALQ